jgi:hypothetical protein
MPSTDQNKAESLLYRTYWKLCLEDILLHLGFEPTKEAKLLLHEFHKRILHCDSIANKSQEVVSFFIRDVTILWAEMGIFVRTSGRQPFGIEMLDFNEVKHLL